MDWDESLDVGVDAMNDQHKGLLDLMNRLFDLTKQEAPKDQHIQILNKLLVATVNHFDDEEKYMESINYEGLKTHKLIHDNLIARLENLTNEYLASSDIKPPKAFFDFLKFWLSAHIKGIDIKYGHAAKNFSTAV